MALIKRLMHYGRFIKTLLQTNSRLLWGMWKLTRLPQPAITVFGGSRIPADSIYAHKAAQLAKKLVGEGFSIITGGGPGIMEAANLGALEYLIECNLNQNAAVCKPLVSAGIGLLRLNKEQANPYVQEYVVMDHFFSRKWLLVRYAIGFVVFPGGFGTLDELFELVTLVQTERMAKVPIVLIGKHYWQPMIDWIKHTMLKAGLISQHDESLFIVEDDVDAAIAFIVKYCKH